MEEIDTSTVAGQYKLAEQFEDNERYQEAIIRFTEIKNKYPYSRFATMAELKVADIQFKRESYAESKLAYQIFRDYHLLIKRWIISFIKLLKSLFCNFQSPLIET